MNRITYTVSAFLLALAMVAAPVVDAQTRGRAGRNTTSQGAYAPNGNGSSTSNGTRPGNNGNNNRPGNNGGTNRPGHGNNNNNNNTRPGNNGGINRPGNGNGSHNGWQNNNNNNGNRPGNNGNHNGWQNNNNHNNNWNHNNNHNNNYRPGNNHNNHWDYGHNDHRGPWNHGHDYCHHVPFFGHFHRPVAPHRWHYTGGGPSFGTILGVTLGSAIGASINAWLNSGYNVASYGNDVVYLSNVPQMNYIWPDAAMYYSNGRLYGSQFTYATPFMDMSRYNNLYNTFTMQYGMPVQSMNQNGTISATWYGAAGRYVTLTYSSNYSGAYYTTLSFGN